MVGYTKEFDPDTTARIIGKEMGISPKKALETCRMIKGMELYEARELLEKVAEKKVAVPFKRHVRSVGHKKGDIRSGRYPVNTAREMIKLLDALEANADYMGLDTERLKIIHIAAHRGATSKGMYPRAHGRATPKVKRTTNIEIVVEETEAVE